jgi:TRAP-type C4-dicarboxylate transport system permease small subunit
MRPLSTRLKEVLRAMTRRTALALIQRVRIIQLRIAMLALLIMMLTVVADVALRYVVASPIRGAYDVVEVCLALFVFHGLSTCFFRRENIVIDVVDMVAGARTLRVLIRIADIAGMVLLALVFCAMITPAYQAYEYGDRKLELGLPTYLVWVAVLTGLLGMIVCSLGPLLSDRMSIAGDRG